MPNAPDARSFHAVTKVLLMPSLMENAGLVAMEAMLNGIPVLASNRGGLPETIGDAGFLFDIPANYTPETRDLPTAEEVEPWVETIIRLWDDAAEYERWSQAARERAQLWHPDRLAPVYRDFFGHLTHQPGPPLVPHESLIGAKLNRATGLPLAESDTTLGQVVGREFDTDLVAGHDTDEILPHPAGNVGNDLVAAVQLHAKPRVGQGFGDDALDLDCFFFIRHTRHSRGEIIMPGSLPKGSSYHFFCQLQGQRAKCE